MKRHRLLFCCQLLLACLLGHSLVSCTTTGTTASGPSMPQGPVVAGLAGYVVFDTHNKKVLLASNADQRLPLGSLSKVATGVLALDSIAALGHSLDEKMVVPPSAAVAGASSVGLQVGDTLSVRDALYATLMADDSLAAEAVAEHIGTVILQRTGQGGSPAGAFVGQLNALASKIGMNSTRFVNPHGLSNGQSTNVSTAADASKLGMFANSRGAFNFFVNQRSRRINVSGRSVAVPNLNRQLGQNRVDGIHTGLSGPAGGAFAITAARQATSAVGDDGRVYVTPNRIFAVGLGSQEPGSHGSMLLAQGWGTYQGWLAGGRAMAPGEQLLQ